MQILAITWDDPMIKNIFKKYGYGNRMPLKSWEELVDALDRRWFETGGGF